MKRLILHPGWAEELSFFQALSEELSENFLVTGVQRGYFGAAMAWPEVLPKNEYTLVVHSLGLHLIPAPWLTSARQLVIIGGFLHFHPEAAAEWQKSKEVVQRMVQDLDQDPSQVVQKFYRRMFRPQSPDYQPPKMMDPALLKQDLTLLDQSLWPWQELAKQSRILLLHGAKDQVVPLTKAQELAELLPQAKLVVHPEAGHGMPHSHPVFCARNIQRFLA